MLFDSSLHFQNRDFPLELWGAISAQFYARDVTTDSKSVTEGVVNQWVILKKGAHINMTLVNGPHGGDRFHWKIMLTSDGGDTLHNAWLKYAIPFEAMRQMNCVFSDYTTEEVQETSEGVLTYAKTRLLKAFSSTSLQKAGYLTGSGQLILSSWVFGAGS